MKIHIDIGHPAHVHLFKNFARLMKESGNSVSFTVRDKESVLVLMEREGLAYTCLGRHYRSPAGKAWGLVKFNFTILKLSLSEKPDIFLSHGSIYTILSSLLLRIPNISLEDTGNTEQVMLYRYFTKAIITSDSFRKDYGRKQVRYRGCHELAYLHPVRFSPDRGVRRDLGVGDDEKYFIVRFVSWKASHDLAHSGMSLQDKKDIVKTLLNYGKVFISSESALPDDMATFRFFLPPERMHHALAFAHLYVGEGATMASEAAVLGTAALYINPMEAGSIDEQEASGLVYHFRNAKGVKEKIRLLLEDPAAKEKAMAKSGEYVSTRTDLTAWLAEFIKLWPESLKQSQRKSDK